MFQLLWLNALAAVLCRHLSFVLIVQHQLPKLQTDKDQEQVKELPHRLVFLDELLLRLEAETSKVICFELILD